jgi:hypothetical protein
MQLSRLALLSSLSSISGPGRAGRASAGPAQVLSQTWNRGRREIGGLAERLHSEDVELLGEGRTGVEGVPRLVLAHHGNHLDATQDIPGTVRGCRVAPNREIRASSTIETGNASGVRRRAGVAVWA